MRSRVILSRVLFVLYLCAIALLLFTTNESLPSVSKTILGMQTDKVAHFILFLPFPILGFLSCDIRTVRFWHSLMLVLAIFVAGSIIAGLTEYVQGLTGYRSADIADFKTDLVALAVSSLVVLATDVAQLPKIKTRK